MGRDQSGRDFKEYGRALEVSQHGAKLSTCHQLRIGSEISIENRTIGETIKANVVWIGKKPFRGAAEIGVQWLEAKNIWRFEIHPEHWRAPIPESTSDPPSPADNNTDRASPHEISSASPLEPDTHLTLGVDIVTAWVSDTGVASNDANTPSPGLHKSPAPSGPIDMSQEVMMSDLARQLQDMADQQLKLFEERLNKLATDIRLRTQEGIESAASRVEDETAHLLSQVASLEEHLRASRSEVEVLLSKLQEQTLREGSRDAEEVKRLQDEARRQLIASDSAELKRQLEAESAELSASCIVQTRKRIREEASATFDELTKEAEGKLIELKQELQLRASRELESARTQTVDQALAQLSESIQAVTTQTKTELQRTFTTQLEILREQIELERQTALQQLVKEIPDSLRETIQHTISSAITEFRQRAEGDVASVTEQLTTSARSSLENGRNQLIDLVNTAVTGMNKEAYAGLDQFRGLLQTRVEEILESGKNELDAQLQRVAEIKHEASLEKLEKDLADLGESATNQIRIKLDQMVKDTTDTLEQHVLAANQAVNNVTAQSASLLESYREQMEASARTITETLHKQFAHFSEGRMEEICRQMETLSKAFQDRLQQAARSLEPEKTD